MRSNIYQITLLLLLLTLGASCQILDQLAPSPNEQEVIILPTLTPAGAEVAAATEPIEPSDQEEAIPTPAAEDGADAPPPLPATIPPKEAEDVVDPNAFTLFESPAGYQFQHPNSWRVADLFGQTIATNDPIVLESGELAKNQALFIVIAGPVEEDGPSAKQLLNMVQQDVLAGYLENGTITPFKEPEPLAQGSAIGMNATYQLTSDSEDNLEIRAISLIKQNLYVVAMTINPESAETTVQDQLAETMESLALTSGEYLVDAATYGLTQDELEALEQELIDAGQTP